VTKLSVNIPHCSIDILISLTCYVASAAVLFFHPPSFFFFRSPDHFFLFITAARTAYAGTEGCYEMLVFFYFFFI